MVSPPNPRFLSARPADCQGNSTISPLPRAIHCLLKLPIFYLPASRSLEVFLPLAGRSEYGWPEPFLDGLAFSRTGTRISPSAAHRVFLARFFDPQRTTSVNTFLVGLSPSRRPSVLPTRTRLQLASAIDSYQLYGVGPAPVFAF